MYDEELVEVLEKSGGDQEYAVLPEQHRFQIPEDALRAIEAANSDGNPVRDLRRCPVDQ